MRTTRMFAAAMLALTGCHYGMTPEKLPVANQPGGAQVTVRTAWNKAYVGELIAVQDDGVVISSDRIMRFPFRTIARLTVDKMGDYRLDRVDVPRTEDLAELRSVSRFPQGLTPNIQSQLLAQKSQGEIVVVVQ